MMRRAIILFDIVFTFVRQGQGAPFMDKCNGSTLEGRKWKGWAFHLSPWRRDRYGARKIGTALCIGRLAKKAA